MSRRRQERRGSKKSDGENAGSGGEGEERNRRLAKNRRKMRDAPKGNDCITRYLRWIEERWI